MTVASALSPHVAQSPLRSTRKSCRRALCIGTPCIRHGPRFDDARAPPFFGKTLTDPKGGVFVLPKSLTIFRRSLYSPLAE